MVKYNTLDLLVPYYIGEEKYYTLPEVSEIYGVFIPSSVVTDISGSTRREDGLLLVDKNSFLAIGDWLVKEKKIKDKYFARRNADVFYYSSLSSSNEQISFFAKTAEETQYKYKASDIAKELNLVSKTGAPHSYLVMEIARQCRISTPRHLFRLARGEFSEIKDLYSKVSRSKGSNISSMKVRFSEIGKSMIEEWAKNNLHKYKFEAGESGKSLSFPGYRLEGRTYYIQK